MRKKNLLDKHNKTLYAVVKNRHVVNIFYQRSEARVLKKSLGGKKAGITIHPFIPLQEIR